MHRAFSWSLKAASCFLKSAATRDWPSVLIVCSFSSDSSRHMQSLMSLADISFSRAIWFSRVVIRWEVRLDSCSSSKHAFSFDSKSFIAFSKHRRFCSRNAEVSAAFQESSMDSFSICRQIASLLDNASNAWTLQCRFFSSCTDKTSCCFRSDSRRAFADAAAAAFDSLNEIKLDNFRSISATRRTCAFITASACS